MWGLSFLFLFFSPPPPRAREKGKKKTPLWAAKNFEVGGGGGGEAGVFRDFFFGAGAGGPPSCNTCRPRRCPCMKAWPRFPTPSGKPAKPTCSPQGKFLAILWVLIAACMVYYFKFLQDNTMGHVLVILLASILGILGSYGVAWFGIRINTVSNSRTAFSALKGQPARHARHSAALRHERRPAARRGGTVLHDLHPDVPARANSSAPASSVLPSVNRSARPCSASAAASSPRSPTSAPT